MKTTEEDELDRNNNESQVQKHYHNSIINDFSELVFVIFSSKNHMPDLPAISRRNSRYHHTHSFAYITKKIHRFLFISSYLQLVEILFLIWFRGTSSLTVYQNFVQMAHLTSEILFY